MNLPQIVEFLTNYPAIVSIAGIVLGLVWAISLAIIEFGAWILVSPGRAIKHPGEDPYPGVPIRATAGDGTVLAGTWHGHPEANGRTLLLLHGLAEQRQTMRARADGIYERGWNVAVLDARGYGESGGALASFGGREVADLRAWIDKVSTEVGPGMMLAVWGRSMGAGIALRAASEDDRIKALVLEAPYNDLHKTAITLLRRYRIPASRFFAVLVLRHARRLAGVSLHRPRPIDAAPQVNVPTLILRGTHDALISHEETVALGHAISGSVEHIEVEGARHSKVLDVGGAELIARVGAFLDNVPALAALQIK